MEGIVKRLMRDKGFGFIRVTDGTECFFHQSACNGKFGTLQEGDRVTFNFWESPKGPRAENVKKVE